MFQLKIISPYCKTESCLEMGTLLSLQNVMQACESEFNSQKPHERAVVCIFLLVLLMGEPV